MKINKAAEAAKPPASNSPRTAAEEALPSHLPTGLPAFVTAPIQEAARRAAASAARQWPVPVLPPGLLSVITAEQQRVAALAASAVRTTWLNTGLLASLGQLSPDFRRAAAMAMRLTASGSPGTRADGPGFINR